MKKAQDLDKTVYVAMSGGVDSSVAAALLKKQGFHVVGVFMRPWSRFSSSDTSTRKSRILDSQGESGQDFCLWKQDREDAMRVCAVLGIPFYTWDFSKEYGDKVTTYMIAAYKKGITPNPDVMCNKEIKFGLFFKRALKEGADFVATGHYAKIQKTRTGFKLLQGDDGNKDQSYFLWTLVQAQLSKTFFPIGEIEKPEVRKLAKKFKLANHDKKDSQGVCFVGPLDMKAFLKHYIAPKPGVVMHVDGRNLGKHDGMAYYTIGQRHGLDLGIAGGPYYVIRKDVKKNVVVVGSEKDLLVKEAKISNIHWVNPDTKRAFAASSGHSKDACYGVWVKIRYRAVSQPAMLQKNGRLIFKKPQRAITPGQSAVFYHGTQLLGGGIIS